MTWFIDVQQFPIVTNIDTKFLGFLPSPPPPPCPSEYSSRRPFTDDEKRNFPSSVGVNIKDDEYDIHIIVHQIGYMFLSPPAVEVLKKFQSDGWETHSFSVRAMGAKNKHRLISDVYYLVNLYLHRDIVDVAKGDVPPQVLHRGGHMKRLSTGWTQGIGKSPSRRT